MTEDPEIMDPSPEEEESGRRFKSRRLQELRGDNLICSEPESTPVKHLGGAVWQYSMHVIAIVLMIFGIFIWHFSLSTVLSNKRVPAILDAPCLFSFLLLGVIFLALGFSVQELHLEEGEERKDQRKEKYQKPSSSSQGSQLPIHDHISLEELDFVSRQEKMVFEKLLKENEEKEETEDQKER